MISRDIDRMLVKHARNIFYDDLHQEYLAYGLVARMNCHFYELHS